MAYLAFHFTQERTYSLALNKFILPLSTEENYEDVCTTKRQRGVVQLKTEPPLVPSARAVEGRPHARPSVARPESGALGGGDRSDGGRGFARATPDPGEAVASDRSRSRFGRSIYCYQLVSLARPGRDQTDSSTNPLEFSFLCIYIFFFVLNFSFTRDAFLHIAPRALGFCCLPVAPEDDWSDQKMAFSAAGWKGQRTVGLRVPAGGHLLLT